MANRQIIAMERDNTEPPLPAIKGDLTASTPPEWQFIQYTSIDDLAEQLSAPPFTVLEIVAHGSPTSCNDIETLLDTVCCFGQQIKPFASGKTIYLSGCNTGLRETATRPCIAELLANFAQCTVFGTQGYLQGTHAQGNGHTIPQTDVVGEFAFVPVPVATGEDCWKPFSPMPVEVTYKGQPTALYVTTLTTRGARIYLLKDEAASLFRQVIGAITGPSVQTLTGPLLIAPEAEITFYFADEEVSFQLLAKKQLLREKSRSDVWQFWKFNPAIIDRLVARYFATQ